MRWLHRIVTLILLVGVHTFSLALANEASFTDSHENTTPKGVSEPAPKISLNLQSTALKILPDGFLASEYLTDLTLDHNQITTISSNTFQGLPRLVNLSLSSNNIQHLDLAAFENLENLETLRLDGNCKAIVGETTTPQIFNDIYRSVPEDGYYPFEHDNSRVSSWNFGESVSQLHRRPTIRMRLPENRCIFYFSKHLPKLTHLYLQNNNLKSFQFPDSELTSLTHLYLSVNPLTMSNGIDVRLGKFAPSLKHLDLSQCELRDLDMSSLKHVTSLHLQINKFQSICNQYCDDSSLKLEGATDLEELLLGFNEISEIEVDSFNHTVKLTILNLSHNKLSSIRQGTFEKLQRLVILDLSNNRMVKITGNIFKGLRNMRLLGLGSNLIQHIDVDTFETLFSLEKLLLHNNLITSVEPGTFSSLINLKLLHLARNRLEAIPEGCMPVSSSLSDLDLSYNRFYDTNRIVLENSSGIVVLNLTGNPFNAIAARWFATLSINSTVYLRKEPADGPWL